MFRTVGSDSMSLDAIETSALDQLVYFSLFADFHTDLILSVVFLELEHLYSTEVHAFVTLVQNLL